MCQAHRIPGFSYILLTLALYVATVDAAVREADAESAPDEAEANSRLTASTGAVLLVVLAAEGVTLWSVRSLLSWHVLLGVLAVPIVGLKIVTTTRRFLGYYRGEPAYVRKGPPHPVLRVLGPLVSLLTVALLASGVILILGGPAYRNPWRDIHQLVFYAWFAVMTVHVLGHILETFRVAPLDWRPHSPEPLRRAGVRRSVLVGAIVLGLVAGLALQGKANSWDNERGGDHFEHAHAG